MKDDHKARQLARLEAMQQRTEQRLALQRERLTKRFDTMRARLQEDETAPNDTQQRIINAALELVDQDGLANLSLRKLAKMVDMQAPALYWHFKNKEALIDYLAEAMLQTEFAELEPRSDDTPWQDWFVDVCKRLRLVMLSRRDGGRIITGAHLYPAVTLMNILEVSQQSLVQAGVDERRSDLIVSTAIHFTFGRVIEEQSSPSVEEMQSVDMQEFIQRAPYLARSTMRSIEADKDGHDEFEDALRLIVGYA